MWRKFLQNHARVRCLKSGFASQFHLAQAVSLLNMQLCGRDLWHPGGSSKAWQCVSLAQSCQVTCCTADGKHLASLQVQGVLVQTKRHLLTDSESGRLCLGPGNLSHAAPQSRN